VHQFRDKLFKNLRRKHVKLEPAPRNLLKPHEDLWQGPPPEFARDVDIEFCLETVDLELIYRHIVPSPNSICITSCMTAAQFFNEEAPAEVRATICGYCFPWEPRRITLSPYFTLKAVFSEVYHASPWDVLENAMGGIHAFQALRRDLMRYFWTHYRFQVTLDLFSGPVFSPLSHTWLPDYLSIIQDLSIELDLTRFGGGSLKHAESYGYNCKKLESKLVDIILGISKREDDLPMARYVHIIHITKLTARVFY